MSGMGLPAPACCGLSPFATSLLWSQIADRNERQYEERDRARISGMHNPRLIQGFCRQKTRNAEEETRYRTLVLLMNAERCNRQPVSAVIFGDFQADSVRGPHQYADPKTCFFKGYRNGSTSLLGLAGSDSRQRWYESPYNFPLANSTTANCPAAGRT